MRTAQKTHKRRGKIGFLTVLLATMIFGASIAHAAGSPVDILMGNKKCKYIEKSEYQLFSNIDPSFPIFSALGARSTGDCVQVVGSINSVFSAFFKVLIGVAAVSAVINIAVSGIKTMMSESSLVKRTEWKKTLYKSLEGLLIALVSWLILSTVNDRTLKGLDFASTAGIKAGIDRGQDQAAIAALAQEALEQAAAVAIYKKTEGYEPSGSGSNETGGVSGKFTNTAWEQATRDAVKKYGLDTLSPADAKEFFPNSNGTPTTDDWVRLVGQMTQRESGFDPKNVYYETGMGKNSVGLLQLSADDTEVRSRGYSENDLKDPYKNIDVGVEILKNRVQKGGVISDTTGDKKLHGGGAYWSVLNTSGDHKNGKRQEIINALNQ